MNTPLVAIVHYHLRRGGVTRVIQNAIEALAHHARCVIISGEAPPDGLQFNAPVVVVEGMGYNDHANVQTASDLLDQARNGIRQATGNTPDLWHIHNHALGKNAAWTRACQLLAEEGEPILLHIHDFAEDGRPTNYRYLHEALSSSPSWPDTLYPHGKHTHYALLNRRDYHTLQSAGVPPHALHLLPNAVASNSTPIDDATTRTTPPLWLYPVRAIRRKNIGEFLLWSTMDTSHAQYGITLPAESPKERSYYERWKAFAHDQKLPVTFDMGLQHSFDDLLQRATGLITTSIAEGFGLAFLEPWLINRPLFGRNLSEITSEFTEAGVDLNTLYEEVTVPQEWIDIDELRANIGDHLTRSREAYGKSTTTEDIDCAYNAAVKNHRVEFAHLNESMQASVIKRIKAHPEAASEINPATLQLPISERVLQSNSEAVSANFGIDKYGEALNSIYRKVMGNPVSYKIDASRILESFITPERFCLLRS